MRILTQEYARATREDATEKHERKVRLYRLADALAWHSLPWGRLRFWMYTAVGVAVIIYLHGS